MIARADLWDRFRFGEFWWMHAMVAIWLVFSVLLFVAEPLIPRRRFDRWARARPDAAFGWLQRSHWILLVSEPRYDFWRGRGKSRMVDLLVPGMATPLVRSVANSSIRVKRAYEPLVAAKTARGSSWIGCGPVASAKPTPRSIAG